MKQNITMMCYCSSVPDVMLWMELILKLQFSEKTTSLAHIEITQKQ